MSLPIADYVALVKPRLVSLVLLSTAVGFYLGSEHLEGAKLFHTLLATFLVAGGAMALNQLLERDIDAQMLRTRDRPLPSGRLEARQAFQFGTFLSTLGLVLFLFFAEPLSAFLALATSLSYLLLYTPLKRRTSLATFVGAFPGALPPLIGWMAAGGAVNLQALVLFLILFFWQIPHFLSIAWLYRSDYERARLPMLSVLDRGGAIVSRQMMLYVCALTPVSLLATIFGMTGTVYFFGAFALGLFFSGVVIYAATNLDVRVRLILHGSIIYLTALFVLMIIDKV